MNLKFDEETEEISIDPETYARLTLGTPFQQSMNALGMIDRIMAENDLEFLKQSGIPKKEHKKYLKQMAENRLRSLKTDPPPGIDPDALAVFCNQL